MSSFFDGAAALANQIAGTQATNFAPKSSVGSIMSLGDGDGKFYFFDTEVPESLPFGGDLVSALHQFPGGARAVDTFGDQPRSLEFSGHLLSLNAQQLTPRTGTAFAQKAMTALQRMQLLQQLYVSGKQMAFRYDTFEFKVVIAHFHPDVKHENRVDYSIRMHILDDNTDKFLPSKQRNAALNVNPFTNLLSQITNFMKKANKVLTLVNLGLTAAKALLTQMKKDPTKLFYAALPLVPGAQQTLTLLQTVSNVVDTMTSFTTETHPQTVVDLQTAQPIQTLTREAIKGPLLGQLKTNLRETKTIYAFLTNDYAKFTSHDPTIAGQAASDMRSYMSSLKAMIAQLLLLLRPKKVYVESHVNPDLYALAAKYYQDASKWTTIAEASKLSVPKPMDQVLVYIPIDDLEPNVGGTVVVAT